MSRGSVRVFLVEDNSLYRDSLSEVLQLESGLEVVGVAGDGSQAEELIAGLHPDVVLMDMKLPGISGVEATRRIHDRFPGVRILGLSVCDEDEVQSGLRRAGATGFVTKDAPVQELILKIREVIDERSASDSVQGG